MSLSLSLLQIARLRREVPADQALWIAVDVQDGVVVMVVPEIPSCNELSLTRQSAFIDAVGRGQATDATVQAEHAALNY